MKSLIMAEYAGKSDRILYRSYTASVFRKAAAINRYSENFSKASHGDIIAKAYLRGWDGDDSGEE